MSWRAKYCSLFLSRNVPLAAPHHHPMFAFFSLSPPHSLYRISLWHEREYIFTKHLLFFFVNISEISPQVSFLIPTQMADDRPWYFSAARLSAIEGCDSSGWTWKRVKNIGLTSYGKIIKCSAATCGMYISIESCFFLSGSFELRKKNIFNFIIVGANKKLREITAKLSDDDISFFLLNW